MPPKARGDAATRSGRGRGRGRGRGGAVAAVDTPPPEASTSAGASTEPTVVPKQEEGSNPNISTTVEPAPASSVASSQTPADSSARPPRQRLDSLKSAEPASRSASPSVRRGASTRGKKPVALPSFTGRRSKEDRDTRIKADIEREAERNKDRDRIALKKQQAKERAEKWAQERGTRGRGGYSGAVSGPFSMASARDRKESNYTNFSRNGGGGGGGGSGSRATRVKGENDGYGGPSNRSGGSSMKMEDDGDVSSENEEDAEFKRKDIDLIELSSDEDQAAPSARFRTNLPVRIGRKEHKERTLEINTEASTEASAKILQETEASGDSQANGQSKANKGGGRAKDIEITGEQNPSKGMQQEPEDTNVNVKSEPHSDDEMQVDAEQVGIGAGGQAAEPQGAPRAERKVRFQESKEPQLQTEEERAEWARFQANLRHIRTELGPEEESAVDGSGDVNMEDAAANARKPTRRDDQVYLFQLPPVIPELLEAKVKKEASDSHSKGPDLPPQPVKVDGVQVKTEEEFSSAIPKPAEGPRIGSGRVGKLRVHQSGRTTLDWGGVDFELTPGRPVSFLQEVVAMNVIPEEKQDVPEISGEAVSFGRVKGKFIVTPDFSTIFG